ncbi:alpha/beta hydrolase [Acaryochloris sp. IP29b_bin.137]|uniref:alpha/beta hydrolase n=1 Tax=Acaryochloris sp. IP29b_bin.137 TaxID=2969217 RepID=UPI0026357E2C|nr:alpha/beta hydrolase [Acaryochloris sp. IP29b_bin.137]
MTKLHQTMKHREGTFIGTGNLTLFYQVWLPCEQPNANVIIIHGLGSHSNTFEFVVTDLVERGYAVYGFDLRGHGRSEGKRGYINRWSEFREDLTALLKVIDDESPDNPCFLYGHSLGATIALDYTIRYPQAIQGVILSALPIGKVGLSPAKFLIGRLLSSIWPGFTLNTGIDLSAGSRNPDIVKTHSHDPLRHTYGRARMSTEFFSTVDWLQTHISELRVPVLMLHGTADRTVPPEPSRKYFQKITSKDKQFIEYPGAYHDLHQDLNYQDVQADVAHWLEKQLHQS